MPFVTSVTPGTACWSVVIRCDVIWIPEYEIDKTGLFTYDLALPCSSYIIQIPQNLPGTYLKNKNRVTGA